MARVMYRDGNDFKPYTLDMVSDFITYNDNGKIIDWVKLAECDWTIKGTSNQGANGVFSLISSSFCSGILSDRFGRISLIVRYMVHCNL